MSVDDSFTVVKLSLAVTGVVWYTFLWALCLLGCYTARKRYRPRSRSSTPSPPATSVPGVSILRPLKGLDANLYDNLESTFTQDYSNFEIFFCVADEGDQALSVVRDLIEKYPNVTTHVMIGEEVVGVNPKINNIIRSYRQAAHDIIWVLDSNVMVDPGTLARAVDALDGPADIAPLSSRRRVALVHHIPFAWSSEYSLGSRLDEAFLNTNHAKMYLAINFVAVDSCVVGKSNLYRRSDVERVDGSLKPISHAQDEATYSGGRGLAAFGRFLAEDNMIASALWHELGLRHDLSCDVARNAVGNMSLSDYFWRRVRWVRVRKRMTFAATLIEPLTESVVLGGLTALALKHLLGIPSWIFLPVHYTLWLLVDLDVFKSLAGHSLPSSSRWAFLDLPLIDDPHHTDQAMVEEDSIKERVISTVFAKRNGESYVAHIKIWEDAGEGEAGKKPRFILLSRSTGAGGFIHKSKLNSNGSFSVGKTWKVVELRGIEVLSSGVFNITMARTYRWQTESPNDQTNFIAALIKLFHAITGGSAPLQLRGVTVPDGPSAPRPPPLEFRRMERAPTPTNGTPLPPASPRRPIVTEAQPSRPYNGQRSDQNDGVSLPSPRTRGSSISRRSDTPSRADSPDISHRTGVSDRPITPVRTRPNTPSSSQTAPIPFALRPGHTPRASISNTTIRSLAPASNGVPPPPVARTVDLNAPIQARPVVQTTALVPPVRLNGSSSIGATLDAHPALQSAQPSPTSAYVSTPDALHSVPLPAASLAPSLKTPSRAPSKGPPESGQQRRDNARVSFYDPANQAALNHLLSDDTITHDDDDGEGEGAAVREEESAKATLESMEEMLEGYEWASDDLLGQRSVTGAADRIEARLMDELMALEKANVHSFLESDDRIHVVLKYLDESITELDGMDSVLSSYKIHLNAVNEDIAFIQSQNRGLQVQTQNQRALMDELEELLQTVHVDSEALLALTQESLEKATSIQRLEGAASELYKALQAGRERDMAATMERLDEYRTHNSHFCKRMLDFLSIMVTAQSRMVLADNDGVIKLPNGRPSLTNHRNLESYLGRYSGLVLYLKEMDEGVYAKLCAAYFSAASGLHATQIRALLTFCSSLVKKAFDDDTEGFGGTTPTTTTAKAASGMRRAGTIVRSPLEGRRERKERSDGDMIASDAFALILDQMAQSIYREEEFIADFLQISNAGITFADYMGLENYFRRQAARTAGLSSSTQKLIRGAMDLIFGFLPTELKAWLDSALLKDKLHIVGIIAALERFLSDAEERGNGFLLNLLERQHVRLKGVFERRVNEQIKSIEDMRLTSKKRNGVAPFIKYFPTYVGRVETQLIGADILEIRQTVDQAYDKIVTSMFDALKHMAKMDGEGEDKGQLNYHVIVIENMHYFVAEISQLQIGSVASFLRRAQVIYEENLNAYVKIVLRRPFFKIIDYFEGVERLLKTTAPTEVSSNSSYSRSTLKKVVKEYNAKDVRKHIDSLFKRVEKHFTEASEKATTDDVSVGIASGTVLVGVWRACEEELLRITELFVKRINQCYKDMGVALEYSVADVEGSFKRHRISG
ncbi:uncharacterized protein FIBRA_05240 [Fibroporia radiculosa]|uniref:Ceramide glucosyltransferase n=1 Tax=Fibroporia radiculosa TaxID=599839 RepID=J4H3E2_9APHY|nr:uncharacterized protein FIBRA_05240 [Fibroporia radiculosa]CCM03119.1 predicted protein [Fibroporia radiculosa]